MLKIVGAVMIIAATAAYGFNAVLRLRARVRILTSLTAALDIMKSEICDRLTPMPELLEMLSNETEAPVRDFFNNCYKKLGMLGVQSFSSVWKSALTETPELLLNDGEAQVIAELGFVLGRYDSNEQKSAFSYTIRRMEGFLQKAETERDSQSKLHAFLGVAAGIFVVIMLI